MDIEHTVVADARQAAVAAWPLVMSDSDSDSRESGAGEGEGACGKLLEEIAEQDGATEIDPIQVMLERLLAYSDLDPSLVGEEERERLHGRLVEVGADPAPTTLLFTRQDTTSHTVTEVALDTVSDQPRTLLLKPSSGPIKLLPLADTVVTDNFLARGSVPLVLRSHPLHAARQCSVVTEFSQWLAAMENQDFTLNNPMQAGGLDSAVSVLESDSSSQIVRGGHFPRINPSDCV